VTFSSFSAEVRTSGRQPFNARILDWPLGVNCYVTFIHIINSVRRQTVIIEYTCQQTENVLRPRLYWSPLHGRQMYTLAFSDVWVCVEKSAKPINPRHLIATSEWVRKVVCLAKLVSQTSYFSCGETEEPFLYTFSIVDKFCFLFRRTHRYLPVLILC